MCLKGGFFAMTYIVSLLMLLLIGIFLWEMRHSMRRSSESVRLIEAYIDDLDNPRLIEEIHSYCKSDFKLRRIMKKHSATEADLAFIYRKLLIWGNFRKYNRFIPITSFFYAYSLNYLLSHKEDDPKSLTQKMMNFFHI